MELLLNIAAKIRSIKANLDYKNSKPNAFIIFNNPPKDFPSQSLFLVEFLAKSEKVEITSEEKSGMIKGVVDNNVSIFVSLTEGIDLNQEISKLLKQIDQRNK